MHLVEVYHVWASTEAIKAMPMPVERTVARAYLN